MPTNLPRPRVKEKRSLFTIALNAFMLGSGLILAFAVVMQEQRYVMNEPGYLAGAFDQISKPDAPDTTDQSQALPTRD